MGAPVDLARVERIIACAVFEALAGRRQKGTGSRYGYEGQENEVTSLTLAELVVRGADRGAGDRGDPQGRRDHHRVGSRSGLDLDGHHCPVGRAAQIAVYRDRGRCRDRLFLNCHIGRLAAGAGPYEGSQVIARTGGKRVVIGLPAESSVGPRAALAYGEIHPRGAIVTSSAASAVRPESVGGGHGADGARPVHT